MIQVTLNLFANKNTLTLPDGSTVGQVLRETKCVQFVVLYNGTYIDADLYDSTQLKDGDDIKLLTAMGGG